MYRPATRPWANLAERNWPTSAHNFAPNAPCAPTVSEEWDDDAPRLVKRLRPAQAAPAAAAAANFDTPVPWHVSERHFSAPQSTHFSPPDAKTRTPRAPALTFATFHMAEHEGRGGALLRERAHAKTRRDTRADAHGEARRAWYERRTAWTFAARSATLGALVE